jgi:hypothetical protein
MINFKKILGKKEKKELINPVTPLEDVIKIETPKDKEENSSFFTLEPKKKVKETNKYVDLIEKISDLNKNSVEILGKLNNVVTSNTCSTTPVCSTNSANNCSTIPTYSSNWHDGKWQNNNKNWYHGTSGKSGISGASGTSGPTGIAGKAGYNYSDYLAEKLEKNIKYSEYVAESIDKNISYSSYLADNLSKYLDNQYSSYPKSTIYPVVKKKEIKRIYSENDPYGEENWEQ